MKPNIDFRVAFQYFREKKLICRNLKSLEGVEYEKMKNLIPDIFPFLALVVASYLGLALGQKMTRGMVQVMTLFLSSQLISWLENCLECCLFNLRLQMNRAQIVA